MNQEVIMWIFGLAITGLFAVLFAVVGSIGNLKDGLADAKKDIAVLTRTMDLIGINSAKSMHSPHTPDLDALLEKYIDRGYELNQSEWTELLNECERRMEDKNESQGYRINAAILAAICHHKLAHDPSKVKRLVK